MEKKVSFLYDDAMKDLLDKCPIDRDRFTDRLDECRLACEELREWALEYREYFNYGTERGNMWRNPEFLALSMAYVSDYHNYNSWKEWNEKFSHPYANGHIKVWNMMGHSQCSCGHRITNIYKYTNPRTNLVLPMGCDCVETGFILNDNEKFALRQMFKKLCEDCELEFRTINSAGKMGKCKRCSVNWAVCPDCQRYNIPIHEAHWKKQCKKCWWEAKYGGNVTRGKCLVNIS
jgi:hypothetical protein